MIDLIPAVGENTCYPSQSIEISLPSVMVRRENIKCDGGVISTFLYILAGMPYAAGRTCTGYKHEPGYAVRRDERYKRIDVEPWVWRGCPRAFIDEFSEIKHRHAIIFDNESALRYLESHPVLRLLRDRGLLEFTYDEKTRNLTVCCPLAKEANKLPREATKKCKQFESFVPITSYGFYFAPRMIAEKVMPGTLRRLTGITYKQLGIKFTREDAFWDLYLHAVYNDKNVVGSHLGAILAFDADPRVCYDFFVDRWGWSRSKVFRFFREYSEYFAIYNLSSNRGSVVYLKTFINDQLCDLLTENTISSFVPTLEEVLAVFVETPRAIEASKDYIIEGGEPEFPMPTPCWQREKARRVIAKVFEKHSELTKKISWFLDGMANLFFEHSPLSKRFNRRPGLPVVECDLTDSWYTANPAELSHIRAVYASF